MNTSRHNRLSLGSLILLAATAPVLADGAANVLPSSAQPLGYSLAQLAQDSAVYNTGLFAGVTPAPIPPNLPFTVVENDATVGPGQYLYLPIFFADDSGGASPASPSGPPFPSNISNYSDDANYLDTLVSYNYGVTQFFAFVDGMGPGQIQPLDDSYITGVTTQPLLDGTPAGTNYISIAAVISPLSVGEHSVGFGGYIDGSPMTFGGDNITVTPEPASMASLLTAGLLGLRRHKRA